MEKPAFLAARTSAHYFGIIAATYAVVGSIISFAGWVTEVYRLTDWWGTGITIKANTSLAGTAAGLAILIALALPKARVSVRVLGLFAALLGGLTLFEHVTAINLGIDTLLFDEPAGMPGTVAPGRMGPPASASFFAIGLSLVLTGASARARAFAVAAGVTVFGIAALSLVGYFYGAEAMYAVPRFTGIAVHTATILAALGIGIIAAHPEQEPMRTLLADSTAGLLARRLLPVAFVVPFALGWLRLQGQQMALYDAAFGSALRTLVEVVLLAAILWWSVQAIRARELEQRRAEAERESTEQRLRLVLDASAVSFAVLAPVRDDLGTITDFRWTYLNPAAARSLKRDAAALLAKRVSDVLPGMWGVPQLFENCVAATNQREVRDFEIHWNADGINGWFQVVASPLEENLAIWFSDVTVRKNQELELRDADRRKDEFLAILAHELRNPLAPIRQAAAIAKRPTVTEAQREWCNQVIERQVQHMALLLDDLLDVSRITRGTLQLKKQPTALTALVSSAVETVRPLVESKKHNLKIDLPQDDVSLDIDPVRMSQVVANLLSNSAKYTNAGGIIRLAAKIDDGGLILQVTDTGIGIGEEERGSIFEMFAQTRAAIDRSEGGLGIGLALTKGLVELHSGTITVDSPGHGGGSTFTVQIPRAVVSPTTTVRASAPSKPIVARRVLVADDNRDAAESLAMLLRTDGHDVVVADDGEQALTLFGTFKPDVLLLDIGMPRLSGYDLARRIRASETGRHALLIAITGWGKTADRFASATAGFNHHLTKPVDYPALAELIIRSAVPETSKASAVFTVVPSNR
ncbi:MAG: ATP-binding protein [Sulfurifustaceae bacterium]